MVYFFGHIRIKYCFMTTPREVYNDSGIRRRVVALAEIAGVLIAVLMMFYCLLEVVPARQ
jgi:hypothetical protein